MSSPLHVWQRCLDLDRQVADHYREFVPVALFDLMERPPRRVLDLGCATGAFGAELIRRYPEAHVVGIEGGRDAAAVASSRLHRVIHARLDDIAFDAHGLVEGEFDTVIASDVLEHLVNPWQLLVRLRPLLAPDAQVLASIPNIRNLTVVSPLLLNGRFDYDERGLLDVTHLRFFTLHGMQQLFEQTGYAIDRRIPVLMPSLENVYRSAQGKRATQVKIGRMTLSDVTPDELVELCAVQFLLRACLSSQPA